MPRNEEFRASRVYGDLEVPLGKHVERTLFGQTLRSHSDWATLAGGDLPGHNAMAAGRWHAGMLSCRHAGPALPPGPVSVKPRVQT